jgi:2-methylcitrate dehydratase PrpD
VTGPGEQLAGFLAALQFERLPSPTVTRTKQLFLDWVGAALGGVDQPPTKSLAAFSEAMGPTTGRSEAFPGRRLTSPFFAAMTNGAASHAVEQDDLHDASVVHAGTVVFPAALAVAQDVGASGRDFITAAVAGYEAAARVGRYLGRPHYRGHHATGTAGTFGAAASVASLLGADASTMVSAFGSAGTQAAGLWEFMESGADSKQLHAAKAAANGLLSAYVARSGLRGAATILEGRRGIAATMSSDADPSALTTGLGEVWAVDEVSVKVHASCRHTHPSADALAEALAGRHVALEQIAGIHAAVTSAAMDVLGPAEPGLTSHQAKFSMGFVLALIAARGHASVSDFDDRSLRDPELRRIQRLVTMSVDPEIDAAYPSRWKGRVTVTLRNGDVLEASVDGPNGDPDRFLGAAELEAKVRQLAAFSGAATDDEVSRLIDVAWGLADAPRVSVLLPSAS